MTYLATTLNTATSPPRNSWTKVAIRRAGTAKATREAVMSSLHDENRYLHQLLNTLQEQVDRWQPRHPPDYRVLYDTARQLHDFPHAILHPKEDLMYRRLQARDASDTQALAEIYDWHEQLYHMSSLLSHQLSDIYHGIKTARRARLRPQLQAFIDAFRRSIDREEHEIFPTAEQQLGDDDWYALQRGSSYLEAVHADDAMRAFNAGPAHTAPTPGTAGQSVALYVAATADRLTTNISLVQLFGAYTLVESIGSLTECVEELTDLGVAQAKAGFNAALDEIMACRDTSDGLISLPGQLVRTVVDNGVHTWLEAQHIVQQSWQQQKQPLTARVELLQRLWRSDQPPRLRSY